MNALWFDAKSSTLSELYNAGERPNIFLDCTADDMTETMYTIQGIAYRIFTDRTTETPEAGVFLSDSAVIVRADYKPLTVQNINEWIAKAVKTRATVKELHNIKGFNL